MGVMSVLVQQVTLERDFPGLMRDVGQQRSCGWVGDDYREPEFCPGTGEHIYVDSDIYSRRPHAYL